MATTIVPAYDTPPIKTPEEIVAFARQLLVPMQGDADKAGDMEDHAYYMGAVDHLSDVLQFALGLFPRHTCGMCSQPSYVYEDTHEYPDGKKYPAWTCARRECGHWHIAKDCCEDPNVTDFPEVAP